MLRLKEVIRKVLFSKIKSTEMMKKKIEKNKRMWITKSIVIKS